MKCKVYEIKHDLLPNRKHMRTIRLPPLEPMGTYFFSEFGLELFVLNITAN